MLRATSKLLAPFRVSAPVFVKETTGLTGVEVVADGKASVIAAYEKVLAEVTQIPESAEYRKNVEATARHAIEVAKTSGSTAEIEERLGLGQVEEVLLLARDELALIPKMAEWKPWDGTPAEMVIKD